ncbi:MAG: hypothetical protein FH761_08425 [Firmicutes bacterium]|nr:hypothetical protein [Bacillota bacterium]
MKTEDELLELFKNANLDSYKVSADTNVTNAMKLMTIENLIEFSCKQNIDTIFYNYTFINEDVLSITEDVKSNLRLDEDILSILQDKFDEYNDSLLELDFDKPVYLNVYCIYQGVIFCVQEEDYWFEKQGFGMPEEVCLKLYTKYFEDIVTEKENKEQMISKARNELREKILSDEEFHKCTNIHSRRMYANKMFKNNENNQKLFYCENGGLYDISINTFIEYVWREYKNALKR